MSREPASRAIPERIPTLRAELVLPDRDTSPVVASSELTLFPCDGGEDAKAPCVLVAVDLEAAAERYRLEVECRGARALAGVPAFGLDARYG